MLPRPQTHLPPPGPDARAHSERLIQVIAREIEAAGGAISFARFMQLALHAPGLGYYSAGARKFGAAGDFVTAPELGSLFGRTLARQAAQCIRAGLPDILELGAGSGRLARDVLAELAALDCLPGRYLILETSAELKARQRELLQSELPRLAARVAWLDALPCAFEGLIIGNEMLDAMPVHLVTTRGGAVLERHVQTRASGGFGWAERPAGAALRAAAARLALPDQGYTTEIALEAAGFIRTLSSHVARGAALFIDYGFPAREYYHPQRAAGTLMCHYRQRAHDDPLTLVGLQDITAHVDFSALARASVEAGLAVAGYATQAQFLINCGITDILRETSAEDAAYMPLASTAQKLLSPAEMGELFKVVAVGKGLDFQLLGFSHGDRRDTL